MGRSPSIPGQAHEKEARSENLATTLAAAEDTSGTRVAGSGAPRDHQLHPGELRDHPPERRGASCLSPGCLCAATGAPGEVLDELPLDHARSWRGFRTAGCGQQPRGCVTRACRRPDASLAVLRGSSACPRGKPQHPCRTGLVLRKRT